MDAPDVTKTIELVRRAQAGSGDALNALFTRYYPRVKQIVSIRLGRRMRSRMDSGDIMQDTFISAMRSFDRYEVRTEARFLNWLCTIAEHQIGDAVDHFTAQKRNIDREVALDRPTDSGHVGIDPVASGMVPADLLSRDEERTVVIEAMRTLPHAYRELILLRDYMGMSWEEVAEETGSSSADAARMRHGSAIVKLTREVKRRLPPAEA